MISDGISRRQIVELAKLAKEPAISIYVPTARAGKDVMAGRIKLKNLLIEAEEKLVQGGMRRTKALDFLAEARALDEEPAFWNDRLDSVALFIAPDAFQVYHLPFTAPEFVRVGKRFQIRPLLRALTDCHRYYVLALDQKRVRLVLCRPRGAVEVPVPNMPTSLEDFMGVEAVEKQVQYRESGRTGQVHTSGAGDRSIDHRMHLHRLFTAISRAVETHLYTSRDPIILAGTPEMQNAFRAETKLSRLLNDGLIRSPKMLEANDLRVEARPIVDAYVDCHRMEAIDHYREMAGTGLTSQQTVEIRNAAAHGRVDVMLTYAEKTRWGLYDPATGEAEIHFTPQPGDEELINDAAIDTIENSGIVYEIKPSELALTDPSAAIFRF